MSAEPERTQHSGELNLGDYLAIFSRRRWPIILVLAAVVLGATAFTLLQDAQYRATASVLVRTNDTSNLFPLDGALEVQRSVAGEQAFLNSNVFRDRATELSPQPSEVRTISDEGNEDASQRSIIAFEATASSAADAADAANAWANNYIDQRFEFEVAEMAGSISAVQSSLDGLNSRRADLVEPLTNADDALAVSNDPVEIARLNGERLFLLELISTELDALDSQISRLSTSIAEMQVTGDLLSSADLSARINEPATPPGSPFSPNIPRNIALGLVSGIIFSLGAALVLESLDGRLRSVDDVGAVTGLRHLASIPRIRRRGVTHGVTESYQRVVSALSLASFTGGPTQVLLVTSSQIGEGKTSTATAIARLLAKGKSRTLLIDGDMHRPAASLELNVANRVGLADYLAGTRSIDEIVFEVPDSQFLSVIPSGSALPGDILDLLRNPRFEILIEKARSGFDHIIIDSPPLLAVVDSVEIAVNADCAILVVRSGQVTEGELSEAQRVLESARVPIVGTVLVAPSAEVKSLYSNDYR